MPAIKQFPAPPLPTLPTFPYSPPLNLPPPSPPAVVRRIVHAEGSRSIACLLFR